MFFLQGQFSVTGHFLKLSSITLKKKQLDTTSGFVVSAKYHNKKAKRFKEVLASTSELECTR